ncbi:TPA: hypothetical protein ACKRF0_000165 [Proteus mirabilis]
MPNLWPAGLYRTLLALSAIRSNATSWVYGHSSTSGMWIMPLALSAFLLMVRPLPTSWSLL